MPAMKTEPCPYKVLHLLPSASDNEIRSAYRKRALQTHPDKGGSAEAFRAVVAAFEVLIDPGRRIGFDVDMKKQQEEKMEKQFPKCPKWEEPREPRDSRRKGSRGSQSKDPKGPQQEPKRRDSKRRNESKDPGATKRRKESKPKESKSEAKDANDANDAKDAKENPTERPQSSAYDYDELFYKLMCTNRKKAEEILNDLSEEVLRGLAIFLASDDLKLKPKVVRLALPGPEHGKKRKKRTKVADNAAQVPVPGAKTPAFGAVRGVCRQYRSHANPDDNYVDYRASVGFNNILVRSQTVRTLDAAVDIHISMVRLRQCFRSHLKAGKSFGESLHEAVNAFAAEREVLNAEAVRLVFRCRWGRRNVSRTYHTHELDAFISAWEETAKRQPLPRAPAKAPKPLRRGPKERAPQGGVRRGGRERAQSLQAKFQARVIWLRSKVRGILQRLELRQAKLLKKWGVKVLPKDIQENTFQAPDDSLCANFHMSDGTQRPGPYRRSLAEALRDLTELRRLQRRQGDAAMLRRSTRWTPMP